MAKTIGFSRPPEILILLAHQVRWQLMIALTKSDRRLRELVALLNKPQNLVSYHLDRLRKSGLVHKQPSQADGREVYYSLDLERTMHLYQAAGKSLHPAFNEQAIPSKQVVPAPAGERVRVLFLCTHNSARSQMAEGILRTRSGGKIEVFSAGTLATQVHPLAIKAMQEINIDISQQHSKNLDEFLGQHFDYVITVCDRARESCPIFPGHPDQIHWSFPDPSEVEGTEHQRLQAFKDVAMQLNTRIAYLLLSIERKSKGK
jgi:thioredoxin type arsenate reductase